MTTTLACPIVDQRKKTKLKKPVLFAYFPNKVNRLAICAQHATGGYENALLKSRKDSRNELGNEIERYRLLEALESRLNFRIRNASAATCRKASGLRSIIINASTKKRKKSTPKFSISGIRLGRVHLMRHFYSRNHHRGCSRSFSFKNRDFWH